LREEVPIVGIIAAIFGKSGPKKGALETVADVTNALSRLAAEREQARRAIDDALAKRRELLLVDGSDQEIAKLDDAVDAGHLTLERLDLAEPRLHARLRELQDEARRARLAELEANYHRASDTLDAALNAVLEPIDAYKAAVGALEANGFILEAGAFLAHPPLLGDGALVTAEGLENWRRARDARHAVAAVPRPAPAPVAPPKVETRTAERAKLQPPEYRPGPRRAPRTINEAPSFGFAKILVLRDGLEFGGQLHVGGDEIIMPTVDAEALGRNAAIEILEYGRIDAAAAE